MPISRRNWLSAMLGVTAGFAAGGTALAKTDQSAAFARWVAAFRPRALNRGISETHL